MKKIFAVLIFLCFASQAFAGGPARDWNDSWGFQDTMEKSYILSRTMAMEFIEGGGFNTTYNSTYFHEQHCDGNGSCNDITTTSIGTNINTNGNNNSIDAINSGDVESDTDLELEIGKQIGFYAGP